MRQAVPGRRFSLRARLTLLTAVCVAGAVAVVSLGAFLTVQSNLYGQVGTDLLQRAYAASKQAPSPDRGGLTLTFGNQLAVSDTSFDVVDVNGDSHVVGRNPRAFNDSLIGPAEREVAAGTAAYSTRVEQGRQVVAVPYLDGYALVVAQSLGPQKEVLKRLALVLIVVSGAGIVVAALAGTAVARGGLLPVQRLTAATERVAATNDLRPIPVTGDDELARMTTSFNAMLAAVALSQERQRQLVADAGHELRTPLTSLRTNVELLVASEKAASSHSGPTLTETDREEIYADVRAQLDELTTLIGDLVELAREDGAEIVSERVELNDVVERAVERAQRRAGDVRFEVSLYPWVLEGDPATLERAVLNLLDNAVKFSPSEGTVALRMAPTGDGTVTIEVADSGPGIADVDLPKVFERFYRSSEARTMPGSGLGLAIVKQSIVRHGGTVFAGRSADGGALLTIRLPGGPV
ncbi:sensor histidine kinase [Sciscionella sediminilitoris]|uniref:sensor histidine kinase n=1 Tax=Sciscionella sediminilitoris TaxID=1445613 RepID=UPI0004DF1452|nr:HAMP domain-containing sensor histidine kinase [Sciscionella sp. SE31]